MTTLTRTPRYIDVKQQIRDLILAQDLPPGSMLPSFAQLAKRFGVSDITIRRAIGELENEGTVYGVERRGTFVAPTKTDAPPRVFSLMLPHFPMSEVSRGMDISVPLLRHMSAGAERRNLRLQVHINAADSALERRHLEDILRHPTSGIVAMPPPMSAPNDDLYREARRRGIRLVFLERMVPDIEADTVGSDNTLGAYQCTRALADMGFPALHHFTSTETATARIERQQGYEMAVGNAGLAPVVHVIPYHVEPYKAVQRTAAATRTILEHTAGPLGFFTLNSYFATGVLEALAARGREEDWRRVGLATFDEPAFVPPPQFRLVRALQPLEQIAETALDLLAAPDTAILPPKRVLFRPEICLGPSAKEG